MGSGFSQARFEKACRLRFAERPVLVDEKVNAGSGERRDKPRSMSGAEVRLEHLRDSKVDGERHCGDDDELRALQQRVAARAERPQPVEHVVGSAAGEKANGVVPIVTRVLQRQRRVVLQQREMTAFTIRPEKPTMPNFTN